jgi:predicted RNA-binding Zn-ribbon protein involved in translation (DUF1610 family)
MPAFSAAELRRLARTLAEGGTPECPSCGEALTRRAVKPSDRVSYVRRRVWLLCPACGRSGAVDVRGDGPP